MVISSFKFAVSFRLSVSYNTFVKKHVRSISIFWGELLTFFSFLCSIHTIQREKGATGLVFHASGLLTGQSYALRVVLFERSNALAVSMRSFRVGAVSISDGVEVVPPVTIQVRFLRPLDPLHCVARYAAGGPCIRLWLPACCGEHGLVCTDEYTWWPGLIQDFSLEAELVDTTGNKQTSSYVFGVLCRLRLKKKNTAYQLHSLIMPLVLYHCNGDPSRTVGVGSIAVGYGYCYQSPHP